MPSEKISVFISYHNTDYAVAEKLKFCLENLSKKFDVFLDKTSISPGDNYRTVIAQALARAQWLLIVCTGFPRPDADMAWSFFEAGQFSATLPPELAPHASKRMVCIFDKEPPSILAPLQGVRVTNRQKSSAKIDMAMSSPQENTQYDDTYVYDLFETMLANNPLSPLRDTDELSVKQDIRQQCHELIKIVSDFVPPFPLDDRALQPRISYEIVLGKPLVEDTVVKGYNDSLNLLFSIAKNECTWGEIIKACDVEGSPKPMWQHDVEAAAQKISNQRAPKVSATKCLLNNQIYRVFTARYEIFSNDKRVVYVAFLPAIARNFDLRKSSGTLLSALILSVRFREQLIPMADVLAGDDVSEDVLLEFMRRLQSIEMEALQFGLNATDDVQDDSPVAVAIRDQNRRSVIESGIASWAEDRSEIARMFSPRHGMLDTTQSHARRLSEILLRMVPVNASFIRCLCEELFLQSSRENDAATPSV